MPINKPVLAPFIQRTVNGNTTSKKGSLSRAPAPAAPCVTGTGRKEKQDNIFRIISKTSIPYKYRYILEKVTIESTITPNYIEKPNPY